MSASFVLIHSPLIGPYSWHAVATTLRAMDHDVAVPSLLPALRQPDSFSQTIARIVKDSVNASNLGGPLMLVAHSAAGAYLPVIGAGLGREVSAYVFVDARLPANGESLSDQDSSAEVEHRKALAQDGMLPPWSEWFGEETIAQIIPDEDIRNVFVSELRAIPLALFDEQITYPTGWPDARCGYIRLSEFYKPLSEKALSMAWPVIETDADHLHLAKAPEEMAGLLIDIVDQLDVS